MAYRLESTPDALIIRGNGSIDPFLLTGLLRHRPPCLLPLTLIHDDDPTHGHRFCFDLRSCHSLARHLATLGPRASGKTILLALIDALEAAIDARLWPDPVFLSPHLVFVTNRTHAIRLIALPLAAPYPKGVLVPLLDRLAVTGDFPPSALPPLRAWLTTNDWASVRQCLAPPAPLTPPKRHLWTSVRTRLLTWQDQIERTMDALKRASTREARPKPKVVADEPTLALLSEALPGTASDENATKAYILVDPFVIGRDRNKVDFVLNDPSCARVHAIITRHNGRYVITDKGSAVGTYLDGMRLPAKRPIPLASPSKLAFGSLIYHFVTE